MELRVMRTGDLPGAVAAWHAANIARGKPPTPQRVARVIEKLQKLSPFLAPPRAAMTTPERNVWSTHPTPPDCRPVSQLLDRKFPA
jgi:hypothetical protein